MAPPHVSPQSSGRGETFASSPRPANRILLVDDDDLFRESLRLNLEDEGFDVIDVASGPRALAYFAGGQTADLVLLDWRMPDMDGLQVLGALDAKAVGVPVILLTVFGDPIHEEAALDGGAVDFVDKSRSFGILLKRMRLITDGAKPAPVPGPADKGAPAVGHFGALALSMGTKRARWNGRALGLTVTEFDVVALLAGRAGEDVSYREIYDTVRGPGFAAGYGAEGHRAAVRALIKRIRQKFRTADDSFDAIANYPGFGYRWQA